MPMTREQLIATLGETTYKKLTAYILSGNSGRDLCDLYLEAVIHAGKMGDLAEEMEQEEKELFKDEEESDFEETFDTMQTYPDSIIWG